MGYPPLYLKGLSLVLTIFSVISISNTHHKYNIIAPASVHNQKSYLLIHINSGHRSLYTVGGSGWDGGKDEWLGGHCQWMVGDIGFQKIYGPMAVVI